MGKKIRVLCFGDSLTWGWNPADMTRFPEDVRWTGVMQSILGDGYTVIEEGQSSRTINCDDPAEGEKNGLKYVVPCMESHAPFDLMIIMLGLNDVKEKFSLCSLNIMGEMRIFLEKVLSFIHFKMNDSAKVLLISPPHLGEDNIENSWLYDIFDRHEGVQKSKELGARFKLLAEMHKIAFLDASEYVHASDIDSVHLDAENQKKLGKIIAGVVKDMMEK